jgi:uncharacterized membrane protein SpoIIM required for sporulation
VDLDSYIQAHRQEWTRLEELLGGRRGLTGLRGDEISEAVRLYLRASSQLADAQTRYHDPSLERYLNALVARGRSAIYVSEPASGGSVWAFFLHRYRESFRRTAPFVAVCAALLALVTLATAILVATSAEAGAGVLPPAVRDVVRGGGGGGDPLGVPPPALSALIFQNNVRVALLAFALGITLGVGTLAVVAFNAAFLGQLAGVFHAVGEPWRFWSLVLPHGLLELTAICIAGGAGLRMGWAMIEPGDRPRVQALTEEARDSVLTVIGAIPAFLLAALIEGFVTGRTGSGILEVVLGTFVAVAYLAFLLVPGGRGIRGVRAT